MSTSTTRVQHKMDKTKEISAKNIIHAKEGKFTHSNAIHFSCSIIHHPQNYTKIETSMLTDTNFNYRLTHN